MHVLVTGGTGLVGHGLQAIQNEFSADTFVFLSSSDCDLTDYAATHACFKKHAPDCVIHLAACVGGLFKNMNAKVDMFEQNIAINTTVLRVCHNLDVPKVVGCLSTCIFPDATTYPIHEGMLHNGPPHTSNDAYAYAKRMLDVQCRAYREQYNKDFVCIIPTNIYGEADNYSLEDGHVIPALIHRCYLCKERGEPFVVRGTGKPLRQFLYARDLARLIMWVVKDYSESEPVILSVGEEAEVSIEQVARCIARAYDYEHAIEFDASFADGQYKKTADNRKLLRLHGSYTFIGIEEGIRRSVEWFIANYASCRK